MVQKLGVVVDVDFDGAWAVKTIRLRYPGFARQEGWQVIGCKRHAVNLEAAAGGRCRNRAIEGLRYERDGAGWNVGEGRTGKLMRRDIDVLAVKNGGGIE